LLNETLDIQKKRVETEQKLADLKAKNAGDLNSSVYQAEKKQIEDAMSTEEDLHNKKVLYANEDESRRKSFSYGWSVAYKKYQEDASNAAQMAENLFTSMSQGMEDALAKFIRTGKLDFKSFANVVLDEIARMEAKLIASKIFGMIGGGGGLLSLLGFSGSSSGGTSVPIDFSSFSMPGLAGGGDIDSPRLVGENGPEMFIPKSAGTIVPNNRVGSLMGGGPQVVYNGPYIANMSAIDTQSGMQFLAKNKQGVWAANQSAQRSLPQSR
jgi:lambda family phage tail tape measure protein